MIISASRRTDIPAFYSKWFRNRLDAGFCLVQNPFRKSQISRISLRREEVDAFVFWTRNPDPFLEALDAVDAGGFPYYFLFTLTGYGLPLEPSVPAVDSAVESLKRLSRRLGSERVVWRYDPIIYRRGITPAWHLENFSRLAERLCGHVVAVKVSFLDLYRKTNRRMAAIDGFAPEDPAAGPGALDLLASMARIAAGNGMRIETCAEDLNLSGTGASRGACIDLPLLERLCSGPIRADKDPGQRPLCMCVSSKDIGTTDSCGHGCVYCYANSSIEAGKKGLSRHDPFGPSLLPL